MHPESDLIAIGVNHKSAPVEVRERMAIPLGQVPSVLRTLRSEYDVGEAVVLSTCNRVEFHVIAESPDPLRRFLVERQFLAPKQFEELVYIHRGLDAIRHLFAVVSSIDSMVVGETEILGQVKRAYQMASEVGTIASRLHILFQEAFRTAGQVRSRTHIAHGRVSVSSVAVELAEKVFGELESRSVLVIGTGETATGAVKALLARGVRAPYIASRTLERASEIAALYDGCPVVLSELDATLPKADIVLVSTGAPHYLLGPEDLQRAMRLRRNAPLLIIDISVPRNVDPAVNKLDNVYLSNIDELQEIAAQNLTKRQLDLDQCWTIIDKASLRCYTRMHSLALGGAVVDLRSAFDRVREQELDRLFKNLDGLDEGQRRDIERMAERLQNRLLHGPLSALRKKAGRDVHFLAAVKRLFGLGE